MSLKLFPHHLFQVILIVNWSAPEVVSNKLLLGAELAVQISLAVLGSKVVVVLQLWSETCSGVDQILCGRVLPNVIDV